MATAIAEARKGLSEGGIPIGSALARNGQLLAVGHNQRVQKGDPMTHAEIDCLRNAGNDRRLALAAHLIARIEPVPAFHLVEGG